MANAVAPDDGPEPMDIENDKTSKRKLFRYAFFFFAFSFGVLVCAWL